MDFAVDGRTVRVHLETVIVAGFTGRETEGVQAHIDELVAAGVPAPANVPAFYPLPTSSLQQVETLTVLHGDTSGEVEPALIVQGEHVYVTLASDHTDRRAEAVDISLSKQVCPKVVAATAWRLEDVRDHWDRLQVSSWIGPSRAPYQTGSLASLMAPDDLLACVPFQRRPRSFGLLMGTVPVEGGIRGSDRFHATLHDGVLNRTLELTYDILVLDHIRAAP